MLRIAAFAIFPVPLCVWILLVGLLLLWFTRRQLAGKILVTVGFVLLVLLSTSLIADRLISGLELQYPSLVISAATADAMQAQRVRYVVVLAGAINPAAGLPPTSRLGAAMLMRLTEGIRLHRAIGGTKLVLSGGNARGESEAAAMAEVAVMLGVAPEHIILEPNSLTTYEQAQRVKELVGGAPIILVTSASHMPRSVRFFRDAGLDVIAAPTAHHVGNRDYGSALIPSSRAVEATSEAFYEALAFLKAKVLGRM